MPAQRLTDAVFQTLQAERDGVSSLAWPLAHFTQGPVETKQDASNRDAGSGGSHQAALDAVWADLAALLREPK